MVRVIKYPEDTVIRTFHCSCGCVFEADNASYRTHWTDSKGRHYEDWVNIRPVKFYSCICPNCKGTVWTDSLSRETRTVK